MAVEKGKWLKNGEGGGGGGEGGGDGGGGGGGKERGLNLMIVSQPVNSLPDL